MKLLIACIVTACLSCSYATGNTEPLVVKGSKIYKSQSDVVWAGKGANLPDMRACMDNGCERSTDEIIRRVDYLFDDIGLDWIRFLLEAYDASDTVLSNESYWKDVLRVINHIGSKPGKYVQVTLFADPSLGADPDVPGGPSLSTTDKWKFMARHFKSMPHVIMGIVNEPQSFQSTFGRDVSLRNSMNYIVNKIRETGARNLILVQCLAYSADCNLYANNNIADDNVAYELHLYCTPDEADIKLSLDLPFVVSEIGVINVPDKMIVEDYLSFRYIVNLCQQRNISYAGWCFDENCAPVMLGGQTTSDNGCGAGNDLSNHTIWGKLFLDNVPCNDEFCDGASAPVPALGPVPQATPQGPAPGPAFEPMLAPSPAPTQNGIKNAPCVLIAVIVFVVTCIFSRQCSVH